MQPVKKKTNTLQCITGVSKCNLSVTNMEALGSTRPNLINPSKSHYFLQVPSWLSIFLPVPFHLSCIHDAACYYLWQFPCSVCREHLCFFSPTRCAFTHPSHVVFPFVMSATRFPENLSLHLWDYLCLGMLAPAQIHRRGELKYFGLCVLLEWGCSTFPMAFHYVYCTNP